MAQVAERLATKAGGVIASGDVHLGLELDSDDQMARLHRRLFHLLLSPPGPRRGPVVDAILTGGCFERLADHARDRPVPGGGDVLRL